MRHGRAQVVWTRMVADLETPVSAMLKLSAGRRQLLPARIGRRRRRARPLFDDRDRAGPAVPRHWRAGRDQPPPAIDRRRISSRSKAVRSMRCATLIAESHIDLPEELPPMSAGIFGYLGYDMVRQMEELGPAQSRRARPARRDHDAADGYGRLRRDQGRDHDRDADPAGARRAGGGWPMPGPSTG